MFLECFRVVGVQNWSGLFGKKTPSGSEDKNIWIGSLECIDLKTPPKKFFF